VLASGSWAECDPLLSAEEILFRIDFNYRNSNKLQKSKENTIKLKKYEINFYRMLKIGLGFRLDKSQFGTLLPPVNFLKLKH
jgi:hypothetical protein